jgi:hypothetical protein
LTGEAARGTKTRPVAATFCPPKNQSAAKDSVSQNFSADQKIPNRTKDYFERKLSLETLRATIRRTIRMVRVSDETAQCFGNEPFVN